MSENRAAASLARSVLALALLLPPGAAGVDGRPDLSGSWVFVPKRSDDLKEKIAAAAGPEYTVGSKKSEQARVWIRSWLEGVTDDPDKGVLTIEQTAREFKAGLGDEVTIYYFGREATSRGPAGGNTRVTIAWQGSQLVTEEREAKGKGLIRSVYTLEPGGRSLVVDWRLEHDSMKHPLEARLAFERAR